MRRYSRLLVGLALIAGGVALWRNTDTPIFLLQSPESAVTADGYFKVALMTSEMSGGRRYDAIGVEERPWTRKPYYGVLYGVLDKRNGEFTRIEMRGGTATVHGRCFAKDCYVFDKYVDSMGHTLHVAVVDDGCPSPSAPR